MTISVHRKNLDPAYWSVSGSNLVSTPIVSYPSYFYVVDPSTVSTLGSGGAPGNDANTSLLLHFDGNLTDSSSYNKSVLTTGNESYSSGKFGQGIQPGAAPLLAQTATPPVYIPWDSTLDPSIAGDFTYDFWFNVTTTGPDLNSRQPMLVYGDANSAANLYSVLSFIYLGKMNYLVSSNGSSFDIANGAGSITITANTWHHFAFVRSGNNYIGFIDGVQDAIFTSSSAPFSSGQPIYIGQWCDPRVMQLSGLIDEYRVSMGVARWTSNFTPPTSAYGSSTGNDSKTSLLLHLDGNLTDSSSFNDSVTSSGSISYGAGKFGQAVNTTNGFLLFNGAGSQYAVGSQDFTIDMWVKASAVDSAGSAFMVAGLNGSYEDWGFGMSPTGKLAIFGANNTEVDSADGAFLTDNQWHHYAAVRHNGTATIYIDGVSVASGSMPNAFSNHSGQISIGCYNGIANNNILGLIDEFRLSVGVARWTSNFTPPTTAYGSFNGNDDKTSLLLHFDGNFVDVSSNGNIVSNLSGTSSFVTGKFGQAVNVSSGGSPYVTVGSSGGPFDLASGDFTIDFWFNSSGLTPNTFPILATCIDSNGDYPSSTSWQIQLTSSPNTYAVYIGATLHQSGTIVFPADGNWHHMALVRNGNNFNLYVDGTSVYNFTDSSAIPYYSGNYVAVGQYPPASNPSGFPGSIDEFRISKGVARWTSNFTPPTSAYGSGTGSKNSTFSVPQLQSNFGLVTSSNFTVTAADYADSNWVSNGWTVGTDATFYAELSTFIQNNFGQQAINLNFSDVVMLISRGSIGGTSYSIPVLFYGNIGDPVAGNVEYSAIVLADNPVTYYQFSESSGTTVHDTGSGANDATFVPGTSGALGATGIINNSGSFDGSDTYAYANAQTTDSAPLSVEIWMKTSASNGGLWVWSTTQNPNIRVGYSPEIWMENGVLTVYTFNGGQNQLGGNGTVNDGNWHHVVYTQSLANGVKLYVDGVLNASTSESPIVQTFPGYWLVGCTMTGNNPFYFWNGNLEQFAVYNYELTAAQILNHYNAAAVGSGPTSLLLHFDGNITDSSSYGHAVNQVGTITYGTGKFGQAATMNSGYVTIGRTVNLQFGGNGPFTIDFWAKNGGTGVPGDLLVHDGQYFSLQCNFSNAGDLIFGTDQGIVFTTAPGAFPIDGNYHHIALVRNDNNLDLYVDGVNVAHNGTFTKSFATTSTLYVGGLPLGPGYYFNGSIDEFRFTYGIALWTGNFTPPSSAYVSTPKAVSFSLLDTVSLPAGSFLGSTGPFSPLQIKGNYLFATSYTNNEFQVWNISDPTNMTLASTVSTNNNGYSGPWDAFISGNYLFIGMNNSQAINIYDISNPTSPSYVNHISGTGFANSFMYVVGNFLYVAGGGGGAGSGQIQIFNISNINSITTAGSAFGSGGNYYFPVVVGTHMYCPAQNDGKLDVFDVSNPSSPSLVNTVTGVGDPRSSTASGNYLYLGSFTGPQALKIFDISTPSSPSLVLTMPLPSSTLGPAGFAVQGNYLYVSTYGDIVYVIDITTPTAPAIIGELFISGANFSWSIALNGNNAFVSDYNNVNLRSFKLVTSG